MNDLQRLLFWFESGRLLRPDASLPTTVHLTRTIASVAGADLTLAGPELALADVIGCPEHLVLVMADGLGMNLLEGRSQHSFLKRHLVREMRSLFPSSTAPALTSLATGLWPAEHALTGWHVYLPEQEKQVTALPFIERFTEKPASTVGVSAARLLPAPVLAPKLARDTRAFMPRRIADSVYSRYVQGGHAAEPYDKLADGLDAVAERVRLAKEPTYTYVYYPDIDRAEHEHGISSRQTAWEIDRLEHALERLAARLTGQARIVVSADHGQYDVQRRDKLFVLPDDELSELLLTPPSGEGRTPIFHCRPGTSDEFARRFKARFGEHFALLTPDEVESLHLMGPVAPSAETRARLGDFLGISSQGEVLLYAPDKEVAALKGFHGGLSPAEMKIPLIVA